MNKLKFFIFLIYLLVGIYFINASAGFYPIPDYLLQFETFIVLIGGILIVIGGINSLRLHGARRSAIAQ